MSDLLEVEALVTELNGAPLLHGVSFVVREGETHALVGESGCGKSITALSIMRLLPPGATITAGKIAFRGQDLASLSADAMRHVRGKCIAMIFQEPATALNPVMTIGRQISEVLHAPGGDAASLLRRVRIPDPERAARTYPHLLSGGQRQRAMIAMALAGEPKLLIADEPTTALDVTIQADILLLLADLQREFGLGILLITHNLGVVNRHAHSVSVMYAGRVVEEAPSKNLFATPLHPYTRGLLAATPGGRRGARLREIPGQVPSPSAMPAGCAFAPRCALAIDTCLKNIPPMLELLPGHHAACFRPGEDP